MSLTSLSNCYQTGEIKVDATKHSDLPGLKNDTSKELRISFAATGTWCLYNVPTKDPDLAVFNAQADWKGYQLPEATYAKYKWRQADAPAGALLVEIFDAQGARKSVLASPASVNLSPGDSVTFVINDDPAWYTNNSGSITLKITSIPKDAWGGWESLGGSFISDPKAVSWGKGHLQVFIYGQRKDICTKGWTDKGYGDWVLLGGQCLNNPSAISWGPGHLETFHIGRNNHLFRKAWSGNAWASSFDDLGGDLVGTPAPISWGQGHLEVFCRGKDNVLQSIAWTDKGFGQWETLGGYYTDGIITSDPAPITWGPDETWLFARGSNGEAIFRTRVRDRQGIWSEWGDLGGNLLGRPVPVSWGKGHLEVFMRGDNKELYRIKLNADGSWSNWESMGGRLAGDPVPVSWGPGHLEVFCRSDETKGALLHRCWTGSGWSDWENLGPHIVGDPCAVSWGPGHLEVFAREANGSLWHRWWKP